MLPPKEGLDAGVSFIMREKFSLEERIPLLLIHGMLHLVGYDHETEADWLQMTTREVEIYEKFVERERNNLSNRAC